MSKVIDNLTVGIVTIGIGLWIAGLFFEEVYFFVFATALLLFGSVIVRGLSN